MPRSLTTLSTDAMPNSLQALATPGVAPVTASGSQVPGGGQGGRSRRAAAGSSGVEGGRRIGQARGSRDGIGPFYRLVAFPFPVHGPFFSRLARLQSMASRRPYAGRTRQGRSSKYGSRLSAAYAAAGCPSGSGSPRCSASCAAFSSSSNTGGFVSTYTIHRTVPTAAVPAHSGATFAHTWASPMM